MCKYMLLPHASKKKKQNQDCSFLHNEFVRVEPIVQENEIIYRKPSDPPTGENIDKIFTFIKILLGYCLWESLRNDRRFFNKLCVILLKGVWFLTADHVSFLIICQSY